jgi:signal transduction histidine kinase
MADLPALVEQARAAGIAVDLVLDGDPVEVPPGLDIAAYRIVQESITNAAKHAPGSSVTAALRYRDHALEIEVVNDMGEGAATTPLPRGGHGLVGMQERVDLFGGDLEATPETSGGFRVRARIPLPA